MDDRARFALRELVAEHGEAILASRERLRGMLSDGCPECSKEINILMIAVQAQVPSELRAHSSATDPKIALNESAMRLERAFGLGRHAAAWAVLALANALGKVPDECVPALLAELSAESGGAVPPPPRPPPVATTPWTPPPPPRPPAYPQQPYTSPMPPNVPVAPLASKGKGVAIAIGVGGAMIVAVLGIAIYALSRHTGTSESGSDQPKITQPGSSQSGSSQPDQPGQTPPSQPGSTQTDQPGPGQPDSSSQPPVAGFSSYTDSSGLFQFPVPADWVFRRAESDTTVDNAPTHFVHAAVFSKTAEKSDLDGWVSEGVRVSLYLPPKGQIWKPDWSAEWQKRMFQASLQVYTRFQNTAIEPVQLGNIQASTTAVMGEAKPISEAEVARLYVGYGEKYLVTIEVAMPSSKRPQFEALDEAVRRGFELKVQ